MSHEQAAPIETAGVMIVHNDQVLLVKHKPSAKQPTGIYGFPAGRQDEGETLAQCAVRELEEETGLRVTVDLLTRIHRNENVALSMKGGGIVVFNFTLFKAYDFEGELADSEDNHPEWVPISELDTIMCIGDTAELVRKYS